MDQGATTRGTTGCAARDPTAHRPDGARESDVGLSPDQGALKNLGHRVARSTVAAVLRDEGIGPVPERPMLWRTFLAAHWGAIAAADFFTTEVCGYAARKLDQYAAREVDHLRAVHSTCSDAATVKLTPPWFFMAA
jgi:hypothetical protein